MAIVEVLAKFNPSEGKEKEVEAALLELANEVRRKEPKIEIFKPYKLTRHIDGCSELCVFERYPDEKALEQHRKSDHHKKLISEALLKQTLTQGPHYRRVSINGEQRGSDMNFWRNLGYDDWVYLWGPPEGGTQGR